MAERRFDPSFPNYINRGRSLSALKCLHKIILAIFETISQSEIVLYHEKISLGNYIYLPVVSSVAEKKHMVREDRTRSVESTEKHGSKTASSRGRRGFLKKAAATGILGLSGITLATQTASASEADEENRSSHGDSVTIRGHGSGKTYYTFRTTGDIDHMGRAEDNDENYEPSPALDGIYGQVGGGYKERFAFNGQLEYVHINGDAAFNVDFSSVSD